MNHRVPTVTIVCPISRGKKVINEADFDEENDEPWIEGGKNQPKAAVSEPSPDTGSTTDPKSEEDGGSDELLDDTGQAWDKDKHIDPPEKTKGGGTWKKKRGK